MFSLSFGLVVPIVAEHKNIYHKDLNKTYKLYNLKKVGYNLLFSRNEHFIQIQSLKTDNGSIALLISY